MTSDPTRRQMLRLFGASAFAAAVRPSVSRAADKNLDPATVTLDWKVTGYHAPFFVGLEQKIFAKHGIDLTVNPGNGSRNTILAVAGNNTTFGVADASALAPGVVQGADAKMFYIYFATTPFGIMFKTDSGITKPKDLEGKKYGDFPGSASYALFPAFANKVGIDLAKVSIVNVSPASYFSALLDGQVAETFTALNDSFITLTHKGNKLSNFSYAKEGLNLLSQGLIASTDTLKKPDLVKRFASGFAESVAAMRADPAKAADINNKMNPGSPDVDIQIDMINDTVAHRLTNKRTEGKPPGWMAEADWVDLVDILTQYGGLKEKLAPERLYTNDFVGA